MNILIISVSFFPHASPIAFRWLPLAREFAKAGHLVHVLCAAPAGATPRTFSKDGIRVYQTGKASLPAMLGLLPPETPPAGKGSARRKGLLRSLHEHTWKRIWWPDSSCLWYFPGVRLARRIVAEEAIDRIYSVALPFTSHLVALSVSRRNPGLSWYADIEDPLSIPAAAAPNNARLYGRLNRYLERQVLTRAAVTFITTEALRDYYRRAAPWADLRTVPPLSEEMAAASPMPDTPPAEGTVRMAFFGSLIPEVREPFRALRFLGHFARSTGSRLEVDFFGKAPTDLVSGLTDLSCEGLAVRYRGVIPRQDIPGVAGRYSFLVNLGNSNPFQLPSKLAEYISLGLPVLNFVTIEKDTSRSFLEGHPYCLTIFLAREETWPRTAVLLQHFINENRERRIFGEERRQLLAGLSPVAVAARYLE